MVYHIILADILLIARIFPRPFGARKKILRNSQNIRAYYMINHLIRCIYYYLMQFQTSNGTHRFICYSSVSYGQERQHSSGKISEISKLAKLAKLAPVRLSAVEKLFYQSIQNFIYIYIYFAIAHAHQSTLVRALWQD